MNEGKKGRRVRREGGKEGRITSQGHRKKINCVDLSSG